MTHRLILKHTGFSFLLSPEIHHKEEKDAGDTDVMEFSPVDDDIMEFEPDKNEGETDSPVRN